MKNFDYEAYNELNKNLMEISVCIKAQSKLIFKNIY